MNVDLVITELNVGGAESAMSSLALGLAASGVDVRVLSLGVLPPVEGQRDRLVRRLENAGIEVTSGRCVSAFQLPILRRRLDRWLAKRPGGICQSFLFHANVLSASLARRHPEKRFVAGIRVAERRRLRLAIEGYLLRRVHAVTCVSELVRDFSELHLGVDASRLHVIPNGVDITPFQNVKPLDWTAWGWPADAVVTLFVGRLHPQKGIEYLQRAFQNFVPEGSNRKLVLIGEGPLQKMVNDWIANVSGDRIRCVSFQSDVAPWMAGARVVVLPSRYEGMPNVILEAMACSRPVVCSLVEGSGELIGNDPRQGFPSGDHQAMALRLNAFLSDAEFAKEVGEANRLRVAKQFTLQKMVEHYLTLYHSLTRSPS